MNNYMEDYYIDSLYGDNDTFEYKGIEVKIYRDEYPESPREWDNLGTMVCWHNRYELGDKHDFDTPEDFEEWLKDNPALVLPLFLYDHSGISISCKCTYPYNDIWDAGQVGYIYVTYKKLRKEFNYKNITKSRYLKAIKYLEGEVDTYNDYLTGEVYGYTANCAICGDFVDSCSGFYGYDIKTNGILDSLGGFVCKCAELQNTVRG